MHRRFKDKTHQRTMPDRQETDKWCRFAVRLAGKTLGAHVDLVQKLRGIRHADVDEEEQHDYLLVFCPAASRVQTDISEALSNLRSDKPVILVVMHHTYDKKCVLAESRRQVEHPNVYLTVDCLFHESKFLDCERNSEAWSEIQRFLHVSQVSCWQKCKNYVSSQPYVWKILLGGTILVVVSLGIVAIVLKVKEP